MNQTEDDDPGISIPIPHIAHTQHSCGASDSRLRAETPHLNWPLTNPLE